MAPLLPTSPKKEKENKNSKLCYDCKQAPVTVLNFYNLQNGT